MPEEYLNIKYGAVDKNVPTQSTFQNNKFKYRTVTLSSSGWDSSSQEQTVTCSDILADETAQIVIPMPNSASRDAYYSAGVSCIRQAANSLTFKWNVAVPTSNLTVFVAYAPITTA